MVTALALLVACWAVTLLIVGYIVWIHSILGGFLPRIDFRSPTELSLWAARILLYLTGWILLIIALARSNWDMGVLTGSLAGTILKTIATLPAVTFAAVLTIAIVRFLPRQKNGRQLRARNVVACLLLTAVSSAVAIPLAWRFQIEPDNLAMITFLLGFVPMMICYGLFLIAAVAFGFGASWTHSRAGGINTVLLTIGLVASYVIVEASGSIPINDKDEITTSLVESSMGTTAVAILFVAGILGIWTPSSEDGNLE